MSALTLEPKRWYSWDFSVFEGARQLVDFQLSSWRTTGVLSVEGVNYRVSREGMLGDFVMQQAGSVLVRATKPSAFRRAFEIQYKGRRFTLRAKAPFTRAFVLLYGSSEIGSIVPESVLTRRATVSLPEDWPLPVKSFAIWLTIVHWKRDAS